MRTTRPLCESRSSLIHTGRPGGASQYGRRATRQALLACGLVSTAMLWSPRLANAQSAGVEGAQGVPAEVVVTANKRTENIQDVPASVSVVSGAKLAEQGATRLADYIANVPGVTANVYGGTPGQAIITIRGIAPLSAGSLVATYIDEAPVGSSGIWAQAFVLSPDLMPFDLDRLEVLRGPQGTLYGATSMGGLIKYVLTTPDTHKFGLDVGAEVGAVDHASSAAGSLQGHINAPLIPDVLAVSASGYETSTPGFINNAYTGAKATNSDTQTGGRLSLVWTPTSTLKVKLNAIVGNIESHDDALVSFASPTEAASTTTNYRLVSGGAPYGALTENKAILEPFTGGLNLYSATVDWSPGPVDVISATSWSRDHANRLIDASGTYGTYFALFGVPDGLATTRTRLINEKFTQEFRVVSPADKTISWQVGAFYTDEHEQDQQTFSAYSTAGVPIAAFSPHFGYVTIPTEYQEEAVFGDLTWKVTNKFEVSGGVRYSQNQQVFNLSSEGVLLSVPASPLTVDPTIASSDSDLTWMGSAKYHFSRDVMAYFRVATGYAPGGANTPGPGIPEAAVGSETLTSYEVGLKSDWFNHHALLDMSVYHIDWSDIQLTATNGTVTYTTNGGDAASNGMELTASYSPLANFWLRLNAAYTDAELTSLNADIATKFILHEQLERVPKGTVAGLADYSFLLPGGWEAHAGGMVRWVDRQAAVEPTYNKPFYELPASTVVDLNASVTKDHITVRFFARNLSNALGLGYALPQTAVTGVIHQVDYSVIQPRTIGVGIAYKY